MPRMECVCELCGKEFIAYSNPAVPGRGRFCSKVCLSAWMSQYMSGESNPIWSQVEHVCEECGKTFSAQPSEGKRRYCSRACREKKTRCVCEVCGKVFFLKRSQVANGEGGTCSRECLGKWMSQYRTGSNGANWRGGPITVHCEQCGKPFHTTRARQKDGRGKFCSTDCYHQWFSENLCGENSPAWRGGPSLYPTGWGEPLRERIRERDGRICQVCGALETVRKHSVHHIDYDRKNLDPSNLVTVCRPCHTRTTHHRDFWQGTLSVLAATMGVNP